METGKEMLSREQLYELVWAQSMSSLAKRFAISDNRLLKICVRMNIPMPDNGHWVKVQFGKKIKVKPLPVDLNCEQQIELELRKEGESYSGDPVKMLAKQIKVKAKDQMTPPDPLIVTARKFLVSKDARSYNHIGMVECKSDQLDIRVSPVNIERALRFMDVLIKTLRARHHSINFRNGETYAIVKGDDIKIKCHELSKRVVVNDRDWGNTELHPTGLLAFKAGNFTPREWKDSKNDPARKLENFLPDIIAWMELEADKWNAIRAAHRREREREEKKEQALADLRERKRLELAAFEQLLGESERWHESRKLREYIEAVERRGGDLKGLMQGNRETSEDLQRWIEWAKKKADWYDPMVDGEDEVLGRSKDSEPQRGSES